MKGFPPSPLGGRTGFCPLILRFSDLGISIARPFSPSGQGPEGPKSGGFYRTLVQVHYGVRQLLLTYAVTGVTALQRGPKNPQLLIPTQNGSGKLGRSVGVAFMRPEPCFLSRQNPDSDGKRRVAESGSATLVWLLCSQHH